MKAKGRITAVFEFSQTGRLKGIFWNAESEEDQAILERGLARLLKPNCLDWLRRLFKR